jgi:hypothetical protein
MATSVKTPTSEKIVIDADSFETVSKMLTSPSEEDAATALMAMEQMDFRKGSMFFAILYRDSLEKIKLWEQHAPDLLKNVKGLGLDEIVSYRSIWNKLKDKATKDEKKVFLSRFSVATGEILVEWGFKDMMKDFKVSITLKED